MGRLLVVVDMQNDFVDGALGFEDAGDVIDGIASRIREYKEAGDEVVYTLDTHYENYSDTQEGRNLPVPHCIKGTDGHKLVPALEELLKDCLCFEKPTFGSLKLANYINSNEDKYEVIEVCGLVSNICVISNAIMAKAAAPEAEIIVDSALTDSFDKELDAKTFDILRGVQVTVR
ncbi:MAG: cysteine hydrolase [Clostridiales bacterium]|nr:cysteine hydrolase [Clostridiales bacterium]